ncbi:hypothetical protein SAMN06298212_10585 [Ruaniaceae bacterium KH17]|nr:hypothetical protein SAMN06298212_10585 [Ruaniaceae bacterium KH17]
MRHRVLALVAAIAIGAGIAGCTESTIPESAVQYRTVTKMPPATLNAAPDANLHIPGDDATELSFNLSRELYASAPAVIVSSREALADASDAAEMPLPILVLPEDPTTEELAALTEESTRLGAKGWIAHGLTLPEEFPEPTRLVSAELEDRAVLTVGDSEIASELIAGLGWDVLEVPKDPRGSAEAIAALAELPEEPVIVVGDVDKNFAWRLATARTGVLLPTGTQLAAPDVLYVALYGHPSGGALGVLGEQNVPDTIKRAEQHAKPYRDLVDVPVVPALEIIATVASAGAGSDGNYSAESDISVLTPLIDAAGEAGMYVVIDLQPGRTDFLTQAKEYEELLLRPYVGLALDPEWRLKKDQVHLTQIGQVRTSEVNEVVTWLADLTRENALPQKILILHSFQNRMITDIQDLDTSRSELAIVMHVDGQGAQGAKQNTWNALHNYAPNIDLWGWKNFYDEDTPKMLTPKQTIANVTPQPIFISYQ